MYFLLEIAVRIVFVGMYWTVVAMGYAAFWLGYAALWLIRELILVAVAVVHVAMDRRRAKAELSALTEGGHPD